MKQHFFSGRSVAVYGRIDNLIQSLLPKSEKSKLVGDRLVELEKFAVDHMHLLLSCTSAPGATADSIVESFISAAKLLKDDEHKGESSSASTSADGTTVATASRGVLREAAIQAAFKSTKFGDLIATRLTLDLNTIDGRRKFFEAATRPGLTICSRILCYGEQALATGAPELAQRSRRLVLLLPGRRPHDQRRPD